MADEYGSPAHDLSWLERLARDPGGFGFHVALRRFDSSFSDRPRLGESGSTKREVLRLGQTPSSAFAPHELDGFVAGEGSPGSPSRVAVAFLGLWGPNGPLPGHLTDYVGERLRRGDATLARFADIFHHRILALFHRAWAATQPTVAVDRPDADSFARYLGAFVGLGGAAMRRRDALPDFTKLHYAARFGAAARNAEGLRDIIEDHFGLPTSVEEFVGAWVDLPDDARWRLGISRETLGETPILGAKAWSRTNKFRIVLGPLDAFDFEQWLPNSSQIAALVAMVRLYTNDEWEWDLRLTVAASAGAAMRLGGRGHLGWTTRIGAGQSVQFELIVDPMRGRTHRTYAPRPMAATF